MKYIIFKKPDGLETAVIFSEYEGHGDMARIFTFFKPIGAGFIQNGMDGFSVYGESVSLGLKSSKKDEELLNRLMDAQC